MSFDFGKLTEDKKEKKPEKADSKSFDFGAITGKSKTPATPQKVEKEKKLTKTTPTTTTPRKRTPSVSKKDFDELKKEISAMNQKLDRFDGMKQVLEEIKSIKTVFENVQPVDINSNYITDLQNTLSQVLEIVSNNSSQIEPAYVKGLKAPYELNTMGQLQVEIINRGLPQGGRHKNEYAEVLYLNDLLERHDLINEWRTRKIRGRKTTRRWLTSIGIDWATEIKEQSSDDYNKYVAKAITYKV